MVYTRVGGIFNGVYTDVIFAAKMYVGIDGATGPPARPRRSDG